MRRALVPALVSLAILTGMVWLVDWQSVWALVRRGDARWLALGAAAFACSVLVRAWRFGVLVPRFAGAPLEPGAGYHLATLNNFGNHVLPMRLGEVVFVFVAGFAYAVPGERAVLALLVARLYDLLTLILYVAVALLLRASSDVPPALGLLGLGAVGVLVVAVRLDAALSLLNRLLDALLARTLLGRSKKLSGLSRGLARLGEQSALLRSPTLIAASLAFGAVIWGALFACFALMLRGFGLHLPLTDVVLGGAATGLTSLLPVNTLGSVGTLEAGWTAGFVAVGMSPGDAVASGLAMHAVVIATSAAMASTSALRLGSKTWQGFRAWQKRTPTPG